mmetsp:Transcript_127455/g.366603  ORF Transcript_127455/g.366603 Transcript_127455/m.366603 type:complete len:235 (+) Transcript_127455:300-1004(+)
MRCIVHGAGTHRVVPAVAAGAAFVPTAGGQADQVPAFISGRRPVAVCDAAIVVQGAADLADRLVCDGVEELDGDSGDVQVRRGEDEVHQVRPGKPALRRPRVLAEEAEGLHSLRDVHAALRRRARRASRDVVLDVLEALCDAGDIATRGILDAAHPRLGVLVEKRELHEHLVHRLLRALRVGALFVRVHDEDSMLATPPTAYICGEVAGGIARRRKLGAALDRWKRNLSVDGAR